VENAKEELAVLLWEMDVPDTRRELTDTNIAWLGRNLPFQNTSHINLDRAMHYIEVIESSK